MDTNNYNTEGIDWALLRSLLFPFQSNAPFTGGLIFAPVRAERVDLNERKRCATQLSREHNEDTFELKRQSPPR